ncbi:hypothetical protein [Sphingobacterium olei]|uniref:hypothetical protein n=1 Tax=Sphingobacterium olei TaxID=2571155 RepID=UPI00192E5BC1|nr:hypothetical protein [Sphingobacterium olei]
MGFVTIPQVCPTKNADLLRSADTALYGRITYQLMEFWRTVLENPTGDKAMDDFAVAIDNTSKIVFSRTLQHVDLTPTRSLSKFIFASSF